MDQYEVGQGEQPKQNETVKAALSLAAEVVDISKNIPVYAGIAKAVVAALSKPEVSGPVFDTLAAAGDLLSEPFRRASDHSLRCFLAHVHAVMEDLGVTPVEAVSVVSAWKTAQRSRVPLVNDPSDPLQQAIKSLLSGAIDTIAKQHMPERKPTVIGGVQPGA